MKRPMLFEQLKRLAEEGVGDAQYELACEYERGGGVTRDCDLALRWYAVAFSSGISKAAVAAGNLCVQLERYAEAVIWYGKGSEGNCLEALWRLGALYEEGRGCDVDLTKAAGLYERACMETRKDPRDYSGESKVPVCKEACWRIGRMYDLGVLDKRDVNRAKKCYSDVLCESVSRDWVKGPEWAEFYFRYAELLKEAEPSPFVLSLYARAAEFGYSGAQSAYVDYWCAHKNDSGDQYPHEGSGASYIEDAADKGNRIAMRYLSKTKPRYAWKLLRLGDENALSQLISYYGEMDRSRDYNALKGRRLCAIIKNEHHYDRPFQTAAKKKADMLSAFRIAVEFSSTSGGACYKIHQWEISGDLTPGGHYYKGTWLELAVIKQFQPAIAETEKIKSVELEKCYADEIVERESGKSGQWKIDKALYHRLMEYFTSRAEAGNAVACKVMAEIFRRGDYGNKKDETEYVKWLIAAARAGDVESARTACGLKIERSALFEMSMILARQGDQQAALRCAEMLEQGDGCSQDLSTAAALYEKFPENVASQRQLYKMYSAGLVAPSEGDRLDELRIALIAGDEVEHKAAAKNILYLIFNEGVSVDRFSKEKISKAVAKGDALTYSYGGGYSGYGWSSRKHYDPLFNYSPDLSWLPGEITKLILCLYGRQLEQSRCKECLSRLYSLSQSGDLRAYQTELRQESYSLLVEHSILRRLDAKLYSKGLLTGAEFEAELSDGGIQVNRFRSLLKILEICGLPLKETLPEDGRSIVRLHESYAEQCVQEKLKAGLRALIANRLNRGKVLREEDTSFDYDESGMSDRKHGAESLGADELYWLRRYSDKGDDRASYVCGRLYSLGAGVEKNELLAERYLKRCAGASKDAQYWLGALYSDPRSSLCDIAKGCDWLKKAYMSGSLDSIHALGDLCLQYAIADASPSKFSRAFRNSGSTGIEPALAISVEGGRICDFESAMSSAIEWYRMGMEKSDAYSTFKYGVCLVQGLGCNCDVDKGLLHIAKASSMGCADAAVYIAIRHWCLPEKVRGERDIVLSQLRYACDLGDERARLLFDQLEQRAARPRILGDDDGQLLSHWPIGVCNSGIHSCDMLRKSAEELLEKSGEGVAVAMFKAGCKLYNGYMDEDSYGYANIEVEKNPKKAMELFERSAILGYVPAITMLGVLQEKQMGFDRGRARACHFYSLASRMGDGYASWRLYKQRTEEITSGAISFDAVIEGQSALDLWSVGYCYENGCLVPRDCDKAVQCYVGAVSRGFSPAMVALGRALIAGWTGDGDPARAYALFYEAACRGDVGGMYFLGKCYELGLGCEIDISTAYMLYVESARQGNASAKLRAAKIVLKHNGKLDEFGEFGYTSNAIVAEAVALPHLFFSILSPRYKKFDTKKALRELSAMGNVEARGLLSSLSEYSDDSYTD